MTTIPNFMNLIWIISALLVIPIIIRLRRVTIDPNIKHLCVGIILVGLGGAIHQIWWMSGLYLSGLDTEYAWWTIDYVGVLKLVVGAFIFSGYAYHMKTALHSSRYEWQYFPIGIGLAAGVLGIIFSFYVHMDMNARISSTVDGMWALMSLAVVPMILFMVRRERRFVKQLAAGIILVAVGGGLHQGYWWLSVLTAIPTDNLMAPWSFEYRTTIKTFAASLILLGYVLHAHSYLAVKLKEYWWLPIPVIVTLAQVVVTMLY